MHLTFCAHIRVGFSYLHLLFSRNSKVIIMRAVLFNNLILSQADWKRHSKVLNALKDEYRSYYIAYLRT